MLHSWVVVQETEILQSEVTGDVFPEIDFPHENFNRNTHRLHSINIKTDDFIAL